MADEIPVLLGSEYDPETDVPMIISIPTENALEIGTKIRKINAEDGDFAPNGTEGYILAAAGSHPQNGIFYFVQWYIPGAPPIGVNGNKIEVIGGNIVEEG